MISIRLLAGAVLVIACAAVPAPSAIAQVQPPPRVPDAAERAALFKAAGAVRRGSQWLLCAEDPDAGPATIDDYRDLNGDGRPEALLGADGTFCHGFAGHGYVLLSRQASGVWKVMDRNNGFASFLATRGRDGWPDIAVGGPGFCFPVMRWNGTAYALHRHEYEGQSCRPPR